LFWKLILSASLLVGLSPLSASARQLTVSGKTGSVTVNGQNAYNGQSVRQGQTVTTGGFRGTYSRTNLTLDYSQGTVLLGPSSSLNVSQLATRQGGAVTRLSLRYGRVWAQVRRFTNPYSELSIRHPNGSLQVVRGTEFGANWDAKGTGVLATSTGSVAVLATPTSESVVVAPNEAVVLREGRVDGPYPTVSQLAIDGLGQSRRTSSFILLRGAVQVRHCVKPEPSLCVNQPAESAKISYKGRNFSSVDGRFAEKIKLPTSGNFDAVRVEFEGRRQSFAVPSVPFGGF
jgi:hypothetical protein